MSIATHFETEDALRCLKKTKNKQLQDACKVIIYCCQEIDSLREELERYKRHEY